MSLMRLQRALARAGVASRRKAEDLIRAGRVRVDGQPATIGMSVDPEGNVYTAAVDSGGAQKFTPRKGANPNFLLGKQVNPGWK